MATDVIARAMAASGGGGGEGSIEDIISGDGISVTGGSTKTITNVGVRSVSTSTKDGAVSVNTGGTSRDVMIHGLIGKRSSIGNGELFNTASMANSNAHAEGNATVASGKNSHAEGNTTISSGMNSHAEGDHTEASGSNSHAGGLYTFASGDNQTVIGKYNAADRNKAFIIGGGTSDSGKNIATVDWDGNVVLDGTVTAKDADGNEVVLNGIDAYTKDEVDKKINKTTIETVTSDANVVTVPENVKDFGMVSMVGGKTVKTKNLWSYTSDDFNNATDFGSSKRIDIKLKVNTKYTLSTNAPQYAADTASIWINGTSSLVNGAWDGHPVTITTDSTGDTFIAYRTSLLSSYDTYWYMLEEGSEATKYESYFEGLHNAPVESVVSQGRNLAYTSTNLFPSNTTGAVSYDGAHDNYSVIAKIKPNTQYTFTRYTEESNKFRIAFFTDEPVVIGMLPTRNVINVSGNATIITSGNSDNYVIVYLSDSKPIDCQIEEGSISTPYSPYNKTTLLLDKIVDKLPDYGCSAGDVYNYIDFEEMVYHHKVRSIDLSTLLWITRSSDGVTYDSDYASSDRKPTSSSSIANIISDIYTTTSRDSVLSNNNQISIATTKAICIYDNTIDYSPARPIDKFIGHVVNYELAEEELIPISDIFTILPVEASGTIEFVNDHRLPVPNIVKYQKGAE